MAAKSITGRTPVTRASISIRDRASGTGFLCPSICRMAEVNWEM